MGFYLLAKKGIRKNKATIITISMLLFMIFTSLIIAVSIYKNASSYIEAQIIDAGYGDVTAWVSGVNNYSDLANEIKNNCDAEKVEVQELIFSGFEINNIHSDDDGQILNVNDANYKYKIFDDDLESYKKVEINKNNDLNTNSVISDSEIYLSPAMKSIYNAETGDEVTFELSYSGDKITYRIAGYFEDPFMGSSMIDMKSFLINENEFKNLQNKISKISVMQKIARSGAMLHIYQDEDSNLNITEFNKQLNTRTSLRNYVEFTYTRNTIYSFMMILQNIFIGFLSVFIIILLVISSIVITNSISNTIDNEKKDFAMLKMIGYESKTIQKVEQIKYSIPIIIGGAGAIIASFLLLPFLSKGLVTSFGFLMPTNLPALELIIAAGIITLIIIILIVSKIRKVATITPMEMIRENENKCEVKNKNFDSKDSKKNNIKSEISKELLTFDIAIRQVLTNKKRYIGVLLISILLAAFVLNVQKLNNWLGPNGEGLMNAFSVADHDIGIEPKVHVDMDEVQEIIKKYSEIENVYALAMRQVNVNGVSYTANVISDPNWFHILNGIAPEKDDEIVITEMVAKELSINIGDEVSVNYESKFSNYKVTGIYQCANGMGSNIGMVRDGFARIANVNEYIWCYHFILSTSEHNEVIMKELQDNYKMQMDVHTNTWSGLDGIVMALDMLILFMYIIVALFILISVGLITTKTLSFEKKDLGIYKTIGFTSNKLRWSYAIRILIVSFVGSLIGMIISILCGDAIILVMLKNFGIGEFISRLGAFEMLGMSLMITLIFTASAYIFSNKIKKYNLIDLIKGGY